MVTSNRHLSHVETIIKTIFKYRLVFLLLPMVVAGYFLYLIDIEELAFKPNLAKWNLNASGKEGYLVKTEGCEIPSFSELNPQILKYVADPPNIQCANETNIPLVASNASHIWIIEDNLPKYNISDRETLSCCYQYFYRPKSVEDVDSWQVDDRVEYSNRCNFFNSSKEISYEFIKVSCEFNGDSIYTDFFCFVPRPKRKAPNLSPHKYNVLIIGIDSISRLNFHRTMRETLKFMQELEAVELLGYNKVGDNTFPNVVPLLTGLSVEELNTTCWPNKRSTFDNCPFIWNHFKNNGYKTAFAEDSAWMGVFNYLKRGFISNPVDYYWRPFDLESENTIGHYKYSNSELCIGPRFVYRVLLNYIYDYTAILAEYLHFGFFWVTSVSHDYLNLPALTDDKYKSLLYNMYRKGYLKKTILLLLSDHGIRYGDIRKTYQGRIEERLPFAYFLLPQEFQREFSSATQNLRRNVNYLTTPYDIHETLRDILDIHNISNSNIKRRMKQAYANDRGISLFLPVPGNRTCPTAGIDAHWCMCHRKRKVAIADKIVKKSASFALDHVNDLIDNYPQCSPLALDRIIDATVSESFTDANNTDNEFERTDYTVVFQTDPGKALFEATIQHTQNSFKMAGTVSRINLYGNQSRCVDHFHMKLYCYCDKNKISKSSMKP